jgi:flavodoxin
MPVRALIVYDTKYGNTEEIAEAIGDAIFGKVFRVDDTKHLDLSKFDLIIIGSPTWGGRPTGAINEFLNRIPENVLKKSAMAAFDTRILSEDNSFFSRFLIKIVGYASYRIANRLQKKGCHMASAPEGFIVAGYKGPLKSGEQARAAKWAKSLIKD